MLHTVVHAGVRIKYGNLRPPRCDASNCSTSALANSIALAGTFSFNGPSGSGRVWVVKDDDDLTGLKYFLQIHDDLYDLLTP